MILLLLALLLLALLALAFLHRPHPKSTPLPRRTWHVCIPRDAQFSESQAAAWFAALSPLLAHTDSPPVIELSSQARQLCLRITVPMNWEAALRAQSAAWFPGSRLEVPPAEPSRQCTAVQSLALERLEILPLPTAVAGAIDPLLGVIGFLAHAPGDGGLRLTWKGEPPGWRRWASEALSALEVGGPVPPRHWPVVLRLLTEFGHVALRLRSAPASPSQLLLAAQKAKAPVFEAHIEAWAAGDTAAVVQQQARDLARYLTIAYRSSAGNRLVPRGLLRTDTGALPLAPARGVWQAYTAAELGALWHLPVSDHPLVPTEPGRRTPPAPALLSDGGPTETGKVWLGEALTREGPQPFGLAAPERRLHLHVIGKTGTGKSTFLANLARQDLDSGAGLGLIDPHGDLVEKVLSLVPATRARDVLYFNAADTDHPIAFNLLSSRTPAERPLVASGVVGVFKKLYGESWGPRLEYILRNAILCLLETPAPSLLTLPRLLTDKPYRQHLLTHVEDPLLRSFFLDEYERYDPRWRAEAISPILNKVGQFLSSTVVRHIVGQGSSGFDLRRLMDEGGIFLANLASGRIGEDNCDLLGGLLVAGFQLAAMSRANLPEADRRDFYLLVDEFQHFANDAFAGILSEARKYRLALTLSHQYLDQVPPEISGAVFGNVGSLAAFRIGAGDATRLAKEFAPIFDGQDLVHLANHHLCVRLARPGGAVPAFSARTVLPPSGSSVAAEIIRQSRERWSQPKASVEAEIRNIWTARTP